MEQVKFLRRELSLRKSLALYIALFAILALILCSVTFIVCNRITMDIWDKYPPEGERYYLTNEQGERLGQGAYISATYRDVSKQDEYLLKILEFLPIVATPIYSALCIVAAVFLFYRNKLQGPLVELTAASSKIADNDLDFVIQYKAEDEMGQLCSMFETMRSTLANNFSKMWRQVEERKRLNAAFAHDLRTPLTVLKGYQELLLACGDAEVKETAITMGRHIARMEHYVNSMNQLQRLEDMQPEGKPVMLQDFIKSLYKSAEMLCTQKGKNLQLDTQTAECPLEIDVDFVVQVSNNLISNAIRYAKNSISLSFEQKKDGLMLSVSDDGKGFTDDSLRRAAEPYYTEEEHAEHFGLGMFICKVLCEHHGGYLQMENTPTGARVCAFFHVINK